jgi:dephospho-CoA kinase
LLIIGLVGPFGSGKSTVAKHLVEKGFFTVRLSQFIEEEIEKRKMGSIKDRKLLQDVGNELRKKYGSDILVKKALKRAMEQKISKLVVDGIRNVEELKYLKNQDPGYIFGIDADQKLRLLRLRKSKERIQLTKDEFIR